MLEHYEAAVGSGARRPPIEHRRPLLNRLVWCHAPLLARAGEAVQATARILDIDNIPSADVWLRRAHTASRVRRGYYAVLGSALGREERGRAHRYDAVTVTSQASERAWARSIGR